MLYSTPSEQGEPRVPVVTDEAAPAYTMPYATFRTLIRESAQMYLDYLDVAYRKGRGSGGRKEILVTQIYRDKLPSDFIFATSEKVVSPDYCQIFIGGRHIPSIKVIRVMRPRKGVHMIQVRDEDHYLRDLPSVSPADIRIISDLRFLISNLKSFYSNNPLSFSPPAPQSLPELPEELLSGLSDEQRQAVAGVFESPISYINGAPGTGKTRMVLSRCVMRYVLNRKRVYLLGPTNNAVEQMLRSVLPVLKEAGIGLDQVYRFGTSSEEFAAEYPQVVGDTAVESLWESLQSQKSYLKTVIDKAQVADNLCAVKLSVLEARRTFCSTILPKIDVLRAAREKCSEAAKNLYAAIAARDSVRKQQAELRYDLSSVDKKRSDLLKAIEENRQQSKKFLNRYILRGNLRRLQAEKEQLDADLKNQNAAYRDLSVRLEDCSLSLADAEKELCICRNAESEAKQQCKDFNKAVSRVVADDPQMESAINSVLSSCDLNISAINNLLADAEAAYQKAYEEASFFNLDELKAEQELVEKQISELGKSSKQVQRETALVLAGTIDASLKHIAPDEDQTLKPSHVFLDEAGYTSLARGMVAFSCGTPVTFLGDHRQLPPVCEMDNINPPNAPVCLWALSVAYVSELIYGDPLDLYADCYHSGIEPSFRDIAFYGLNTSYRFGPLLADILATYVYSEHFCGVSGALFEILVLDAPHSPDDKPRTSSTEVDAIQDFLIANPADDFAILAPYRNQISLLQKTLPYKLKDSILTVHRSQGREWDTVFLSVTDVRPPFFTNSKIPIGRSVINTAISRTKRRLVIVCDADVWDDMPDQMVSALLRCGSRIAPPYDLS